MGVSAENLPNDLDTLKAIIVQQTAEQQQLCALQRQQAQQLAQYQAQVAALQEQLNLLLHKRFAPSSEQASPDQLRLFNEAEADAQSAAAEAQGEAIPIAAHTRKPRGRKPLPAALPRIEVIHDLEDADKVCPHDGHVLVAFGEAVSEQLDIIPAQVRVIRHIRKKYACAQCEQGVKIAPAPAQPIPKSLASPGLLAHIAVAKYADALPLYRQEKILQRSGIELPRATLAHWMVKAGRLVQPLINLLREVALDYDLIAMDETPVQVLKEPGRAATAKAYLWVQRGGPPAHPLILYDYDPSRSQAVPERLLDGFSGYLQSDGYDGYNGMGAAIVQVGCWAHARRKFDEAVKAQGQGAHGKAGKARLGLAYIQRLYRIERALQAVTPEARYHVRRQQAKPILDALRAWLDQSLPQVAPKSATGKALGYVHNQWDKLVRYLDDGRLPIDNNRTENAIRPFVLGRKNWLFSDTVAGAQASANLYSLIETAKANALEPYHYLRHVFTELPKAQSLEHIEALLPHKLNTDTRTRLNF
jgi:transposase